MEPQLPYSGQEMAPLPAASISHPPSPAAGPRPPAPSYADIPDDDSDPPGLLEYWRILRRRKGTVLLITFLGILTAVLVTLPQTPVYQARTSLEIQDINDNFMNMKQVNPISESGTAYSALSDIQTQIKILQSESLVERVAAKLHAEKPQDFKPAPSRINAWRHALNLPDPAPVNALEQAIALGKKNLKVRAAGQTRIVEVLYDSADPAFAANFVNTLAAEFIEQNMEARWKMTQHTGEFLTRQLEDMRIKLERSEDALQRYARQAGLVFTSEKNNVSDDKLRQLQEELSRVQSDRMAKQTRFEMASNAAPETLPDVLNDPALRDYQSRLTDLRRQQAEIAATYTSRYSKSRRLESQIAVLEAALQRDRAAIIKRIRNEYDESLRREKLIAAAYARQSQLVTSEAEKSIQYNILKREVDSNRQIYEAMLQKVKEAGVAGAMRASNVRVVDSAKPPRFPYKPSLPLNSALGLLSGLFLGVAFVVMRERADRSLQQPGDAAFYLNVPELGVIPAATGDTKKRFYYRLGGARPRPAQKPALELTVVPPPDNLPDTVETVTWKRKPSAVAESFRATLTSIFFSGQNGNRPRVLVLTSPGPGEGKTTITSNLAIALAEIRQKVLLIDADLRRPRVHDIFALNNDRGLSTLLQERPLPEHALDGLLQETNVPGLFVLPAGPPTSSAANLLYSGNLAELVARFKKEFDMVLIDTPPMLQLPDARVAARLADAVILVLRSGKTTRDAALAARQRFADDNVRVLGTVLNDWNPKASPNGYYGYYNGYYKGHSHYYGNPDRP